MSAHKKESLSSSKNKTKNDDIDSKIADFMAVSISDDFLLLIKFSQFKGY